MRTLGAGLDSLKRSPVALLPLTIEGGVVALFYLAGWMPQGGGGAAAAAAFPFDVYFDLKQAIAFAPGWMSFGAFVVSSILVRGAVLAVTLWLADEQRDPLARVFRRTAMLCLRGAVVLFPAATMFFIGVATRYAPFVLLAAVLGVIPAARLAGRAIDLDASGEGASRGYPGISGLLGYGYLVAASGAVISVLSARGTWAPALFVALMGPVHGLIFLGWRARARSDEPRSSRVSLAVTLVLAGALLANSLLDRSVREAPPAADRIESDATLLLLSGADSATDRGSLYGFDPRAIGFPFGEAILLSYRDGEPYGPDDTKVDLDDTALTMSKQIAGIDPPRFLLGHSQASQILDRIESADLPGPEVAAVLAPPAPYPPPVDVPDPGVGEPGRVGGDLSRAFSGLLDLAGLQPLDIDAPASPTNLEEVPASGSDIPRLSVWALVDSVWLSGDWRDPGSVNVVAFTDHVGVINDPLAIDATRRFFAGETLEGDGSSWRGLVASLVRYTFEPWRP